ncbi:MAG: FAD-binding oxidoreductase [Rhodospirillales bacterium]|jgi:glycine/D-amino acid oxidase-like deaminating enzyme|nr:FAD-binding oxidoreductase [Rhodospirillales bacterium]
MTSSDKSVLPKSVDAIIIGGGIIGCSTAYYLAKRGLNVLVFEKSHTVGHEQSSRNWGFVRQLGRDPKELPMMMRSADIWKGLEKELDADLGWQQGGILGMTEDASVLPDYEKWRDVSQTYDLETKVLSTIEVNNLIPGMARTWAGGIYVPSDGNADPEITTQAIAKAFEGLGGRVETNCAVLDIEVQGGKVSGVISENGSVKAPIVIVSAGAWASRVLSWLGIDMPQMRIRGTVARSMPVDPITDIAAWTPTLGFVQRKDGCFNVSGLDITDHDVSLESLRYAKYFIKELIEHRDMIRLHFGHPFLLDLIGRIPGSAGMSDPLRRARIHDPMPNSKRIQKCFHELHATFPATAGVPMKKAWAGHIDVTPDMLPVIDAEAGPSGLIISSGFSGHGFGIGPGAGATIAELASGDKPDVDISDFALNRFVNNNWDEPYNLI